MGQQLTPELRTELPNPHRTRGRQLQFTTRWDTSQRPRKTLGTKPKVIHLQHVVNELDERAAEGPEVAPPR